MVTGEYVYFVDADDSLLEGSLKSMVQFAQEHASDIVVPKIRAVNRYIHEDVFTETQVDADIRKLVRSNFVCKLYRSDFLRAAGLSFEERKIRLEDAIFCFRAYAASSRTSILADRDYYVLNLHEEGVHISRSAIDPDNHSEGAKLSLEALSTGRWSFDARAEAEADFFRRVVLVRYNRSFLDRSARNQSRWIQASSSLAANYISDEQAQTYYGELNVARLWALRRADTQAVLSVCRRAKSRAALVFARMASAQSSVRELRITGDLQTVWKIDRIQTATLEARSADGRVIASADADVLDSGTDDLLAAQSARFEATMPTHKLVGRGTVKFYIVTRGKNGQLTSSRLSRGTALLPDDRRLPLRIQWLCTRFDGVSLRIGIPGGHARRALASLVKSGRERLEARRAKHTAQVVEAENDAVLPGGRYFALTWTIPDQFGGMTSVLLQRSRAIADVGQQDIEILTLDPDLDVEARENRLREAGKLADRMRVRNIWNELCEMNDKELRRLSGGVKPGPLNDFETVGTPQKFSRRTEYRAANDNAVTRVEHHRPDGSLLAVEHFTDPGRRNITLVSRAGKPIGEWSLKELYFSWLDFVTGSGHSFLICDSKAVGKFLHEYQRDHVVVAQVFHSTHIAHRARTIYGPLTDYHIGILINIGKFDVVTMLTDTQRKDAETVIGACQNLVTIPNAIALAPGKEPSSRDRVQGIMVGRLNAGKRVDHGIRAVSQINPDVGVRLSIVGSGPTEEALKRLAQELGMESRIEFEGYQPNAAEKFPSASFSVLSSKFEGLPLVVLESMASGCIPVSYDIRYGPGDIITDGVDGFLVPNGDIAALAEKIRYVATMPEEDLIRMREAAVRRAHDFSEKNVLSIWGRELRAALQRKAEIPDYLKGASGLADVKLHEVQLSKLGGLRLIGELGLEDGASDVDWCLLVKGRKCPYVFRIPIQTLPASARQLSLEVEVPYAGLLSEFAEEGTLDLYVQRAESRTGAGKTKPATPHINQKKHGPHTVYATDKHNLSIQLASSSA